MFVTNWISTTKIKKISEITNFFRHYFLSRTEVLHIPPQKEETIYTCYYEAIRYTITQAINNKTIIPITKSLSK